MAGKPPRIHAKSPMTFFLRDILRQPRELQRTISHFRGAGRSALHAAADAVRGARHVYLTGIGSSWHAALNVGALFSLSGRPVHAQDVAELVQFAEIPRESAIIAISRSGRSVEILQMLGKARESGAAVIGITNVQDGPLALEAQFPVVVPTELDHAISVNTYSTLAAAGEFWPARLPVRLTSFLRKNFCGRWRGRSKPWPAGRSGLRARAG